VLIPETSRGRCAVNTHRAAASQNDLGDVRQVILTLIVLRLDSAQARQKSLRFKTVNAELISRTWRSSSVASRCSRSSETRHLRRE
jgi:hypothetical protein